MSFSISLFSRPYSWTLKDSFSEEELKYLDFNFWSLSRHLPYLSLNHLGLFSSSERESFLQKAAIHILLEVVVEEAFQHWSRTLCTTETHNYKRLVSVVRILSAILLKEDQIFLITLTAEYLNSLLLILKFSKIEKGVSFQLWLACED